MLRSNSAVSSVVGVVLLLLLVVLAASVIGLTLSAATQNAVESTPNVQFILSADPQMLYHGGGDILYKDRLKFYDNGVDITSDVSIDSDDAWTEWRTGQAITLPDDYYVANLTIIAVDTLGRDQLLYRGSGVVVTPVPTVLPNATFTIHVDAGGRIVSVGDLPLPPTEEADVYILMDSLSEPVTLTFTAVEIYGNVEYMWSSFPVVDPLGSTEQQSYQIEIDAEGIYTVKLDVTNSSGVNSSQMNVYVGRPQLNITVSGNGYWSSIWKYSYDYNMINVNVLSSNVESANMEVHLYANNYWGAPEELNILLDTMRSMRSTGDPLTNDDDIQAGDSYYYFVDDDGYNLGNYPGATLSVTVTKDGVSKVIYEETIYIKEISSYVYAYALGTSWKDNKIKYHGIRVYVGSNHDSWSTKKMTTIIIPEGKEAEYHVESDITAYTYYYYIVGDSGDPATHAEVIVQVEQWDYATGSWIVQEKDYAASLSIPKA